MDTYAAVALDRILSMRTGVTMTPLYALPPIASTPSSIFVGFHPWMCNHLRRSFSLSSCQDRSSEQPGAHGGERLPYALCVCLFAPCVLVPHQLSFPGVARVIITAKQALVGEYVTVLQRLVDILRKVAPNPSNPNFDQYIFESISGLIRFIGATVPDSIRSPFSSLRSSLRLQKSYKRT